MRLTPENTAFIKSTYPAKRCLKSSHSTPAHPAVTAKRKQALKALYTDN